MKTIIDIPDNMKALVLHQVGELTLDTVPVPKLEAGTVLVKIKASGICSSDIERVFINGTYHFPTIPGHEFSGQIVAIGDDVDEALLGKRTCVFPLLPCRKCHACEIEEYAQCSSYSYFGSRCDGGFAEYLVVPVWNLIPFDDSLDYKKAALCEPSAVSIHAVNLADIKQGEKVAVIGTGTIGYIIANFAKQYTDHVTICGRSEGKLKLAEELGFDSMHIQDMNGERLFDVVIEAVGSNEAISCAISNTAALGRVVLVGNPKDDLQLQKNVYWSVLRKQIKLMGSWNSSYNSKVNDWKQALDALAQSSLADKLVTHTFSMEESEKAFEVLRDNNVATIKVMFVLD